MAYCNYCGHKIPDGVNFCPECGANIVSPQTNSPVMMTPKKEETAFQKFSKFFGIILMILSFVDFQSDPPLFTIIFSLAIIIGAIFCLSQKYRLKGFTIVALIVAALCLMLSISQGKEMGFLRVPAKEEYSQVNRKASSMNEAKEQKTEKSDMPSKAEIEEKQGTTSKIEIEEKQDITSKIEKEEMPDTTSKVKTEKTETEDKQDMAADVETDKEKPQGGVTPELKEFLDSYEEFVDEYVDFMKGYLNDPTNVVSMLGEYTEIMTKYTEFMDKIDKYDSKDMSVEDAKYYLEVTTRCTQKMLELY